MGKLEDLIDELREDGREDDAEELEKLKGSNLRKRVGEAEKAIKERDELKAQVEKLQAAPKRAKAFEDFGVDLENLSKAERKILDSYDGDLDEDAIGKLVEEFDLPLTEEGSAEDKTEETPAAEKVARAARKSGEGSKGGKAEITPDQAAEWSADKFMKFVEDHPEEAEALKRGESVIGLTA